MPRPLQFRRSFPWLIAMLAVLLPVAVAVRFSFLLTPLQRQYLGTYMSSSMLSGMAKDVTLRSILLTAPKRKPAPAHDADVVELSPAPDPTLSLALSPEARSAGWTALTWEIDTSTARKTSYLFSRRSILTGKVWQNCWSHRRLEASFSWFWQGEDGARLAGDRSTKTGTEDAPKAPN